MHLCACELKHACVSQGKVGVTVARKRTASQEAGFSSYLRDLRSRCDTLPQTPVKRLKVSVK